MQKITFADCDIRELAGGLAGLEVFILDNAEMLREMYEDVDLICLMCAAAVAGAKHMARVTIENYLDFENALLIAEIPLHGKAAEMSKTHDRKHFGCAGRRECCKCRKQP